MSLHRSQPDPAHGVFETMLVRDGRPLELDAHVARLGASVARLYGVPDVPGVADVVLDHARGLRLGRLRVTATPDVSGKIVTDVRRAPVRDTLVFPGYGSAVHLRPLSVAGGLGAHKWADRRILEAAEVGDAVPLVVDADDSVLEAARANLFVVEDGAIFTPPADGRILPGVTRRRVMDLLPVSEEAISIDRLVAADEVFLSGSVRGIEPVKDCEGVGSWPEGRVTTLVADELRRLWEMDR